MTNSNVTPHFGNLRNRTFLKAMIKVIKISSKTSNRGKEQETNYFHFQSRKQLYNSKCPSVSLSVTKTPKPLRIMPISQISAYQPSCQSAIVPLSHHAPPPPLSASQNHNYWPWCLSAIMPIWPFDLCPNKNQKAFLLSHNLIRKS